MELKKLYISGKEKLQNAGFEMPERELPKILEWALDCRLSDIYSSPERIVAEPEVNRFYNTIECRIKGEPLAYITGRIGFYSREFTVNSSVLIPRPETEVLTQRVLDAVPADAGICVLEVGSGSGCISVTLALERPGIRVIATDISFGALLVSVRNAVEYGVSNRILFCCSDITSCVKKESVDIIVSNPPYVSASEYCDLPGEVRDHEPSTALLGGEDGLDIIRSVILRGANVLKAGGLCFIETGYNQAEKVSGIFRETGYSNVEIYCDMKGIERVVAAQWKK